MGRTAGVVVEGLEARQLLAAGPASTFANLGAVRRPAAVVAPPRDRALALTTQAVTGLRLVNAYTDRVLSTLVNGARLDLRTLGTQLSIKADTSPATVGSVRFILNSRPFHIDNFAPYALRGGTGSNYAPWTPAVGSYTLLAIPYTGVNGTGTAGRAMTVSFTVVNTTTTPPPPTPAPVAKIAWTTAPRSPLYRTEAQVVQVGSKLYVLGGYTSGSTLPVTRRCHVFDMATARWTEIAPLPSGAASTHAGVASDGRYIYLVGGQPGGGYGTGTNRSFRYDILSNTWSPWVSLPQIRYGGALTYLNGTLYYFAGNHADRVTVAREHWAINVNNPGAGWVAKAPIPIGGDHISRAVVNGQIYAVGGEHGHHGIGGTDPSAPYVQHPYLFRYNPATNAWTRLADMPVPTSHTESTTFVVNGKILVIGGVLTGGEKNVTSAARVYNPATNRWTSLSTPYPKRIQGATAGYWNGRIYATNGYSPDNDDNTAAWWGTVSGI